MPQTVSLHDVAQAVVDELKAEMVDLGLNDADDVYYGVETRYPRYPAIAVEPASVNSEPTSTQLRMTNRFILNIFLYEGELINQQVKKKNRDQRAGVIRAKLHANRTLGGLVAHGNITNEEPGVAVVQASMVMASRLTWQGISKTEM